MRTAIFFRHGKSDWSADYDEDFNRPLKKRGEKAARLMGEFLTWIDLKPDLIVTSPALRARATAHLASEAGGWNAPVQERKVLYEGGPDHLLEIMRTSDDASVDTLLVVGHEPTWSETVSRLIGGGEVRFPTAAMACVQFDTSSWHDVAFGEGTLLWLLPPKVLKAALD